MKEQHAWADPSPLGLAAFAIVTFISALINTHLIPVGVSPLLISLGFFYGGVAQVIVGLIEFRRHNSFGGTAFTSYGFFWVTVSTMDFLQMMHWLDFGSDKSTAMGVHLLAWTILTVYMWIGSFKIHRAMATTFTFLLITFICLTLTAFGITNSAIAGYFGLITAFCAWYMSAAGIINPLFGREILYLGEAAPAPKWSGSEA